MNFANHFFSLITSLVLLAPSCLKGISSTSDFDSVHFPQEHFSKNNQRLIEADELFDAALYPQAILLYQDILNENTSLATENVEFLLQTNMQTRFHLAQTFFILEQFDSVIQTLKANLSMTILSPELREVQLNSLYLQALAYKNLNDYLEAQSSLKIYLQAENSTLLPFFYEAQFELALIDFLNKNVDEAKSQLEALPDEKIRPSLKKLKILYLAKIEMAKGNYSKAEEMLTSLASEASIPRGLQDECFYLLGEVFYQQKNYPKAIDFFEKSLPPSHPQKSSWYVETLSMLGWSHLKIAEESGQSLGNKILHFDRAEVAFKKLIALNKEEKNYLALGQTYLMRANLLQEDDYYLKAEELLATNHVFLSKDGQAQALLMRAEAAPSYVTRNKFYQQLTDIATEDHLFKGKSWYMRALNDFENGEQLAKEHNQQASRLAFEQAATHFSKAFHFFNHHDYKQAAESLKYQALATSFNSEFEAFQLIDGLINHTPLLWSESPQDEIFYLKGFWAIHLAKGEKERAFNEIAQASLLKAADYPQSKFGDKALNLLASIKWQAKNYQEAEIYFLKLIKDFPTSSFATDAWYWLACCSEKLNQPLLAKERKAHLFENYPASSYAPEAYFTYYFFQDYLQGDRQAIKHLQTFTQLYPTSPFVIEAFYLTGLDYKRDRKTLEGKWIRKKSLTEAIDYFQKAEATYDLLLMEDKIPENKKNYYLAVQERAHLERALTNLTIAEESQGTKKQIYLDYAEDVFNQLIHNLTTLPQSDSKEIQTELGFSPLLEEAYFGLSLTYLKSNKDTLAESTLMKMQQLYQLNHITRSYYLSRMWYEKGMLAFKNNHFDEALQDLKKAEESSKGNLLGTDQKLTLWIQQSLCYSELRQFDQAILILSKVVNDDAISSLRLKAMYLRAETYERQGRPEIARKQLESMSNKGGIWSLKAKEKLEKDYDY